MSTTSTVRTSTDAHLLKKTPTSNYGKSTVLGFSANSTYAREGLAYFASPIPRGATVLSAKLVYRQKGAVAGSVTVSVQRYKRSWSENGATWNNCPHADVLGPIASLTKNSPNGALWEFNVTALMQEVADGASYRGFRIWTNYNNGNAYLGFYSQQDANHRPYLQVTYTTSPDKPTRLKPAHGAVSKSHPKLECDFTDTAGSTALLSMQAQIDTTNTFATPDWDSGAVPVSTPVIDTADPTLPNPFPGIVDGDITYWRCRVQDGDGLWSTWSDSVQLVKYAKGTITILNPAEPAAGATATVSEYTPPILWQFTGGVQDHWQILILDDTDPKKVLYDSGKRVGDDTGWTLPSGVLHDGGTYRLVLRCWDDVEREATIEDAVYAELTRTFKVDYDPATPGVDTITAEQPEIAAGLAAPWVDLTWTRAQAPDGWSILRDGKTLVNNEEVDDLMVVDPDGVTYRWRDHTARPSVPHVYEVKAVVNGKLSSTGPSATFTPLVEGIWIVDPTSSARAVVLGGKDYSTSQDDLAGTYQAVGAQTVVRAVQGLTGLSGSIDGGLLYTRPGAVSGYSWELMETRLNRFKERPADTFRLVLGDLNIPVVLANIKIAPHQSTLSEVPLKQVWVSWWQNGEHPYAAGL